MFGNNNKKSPLSSAPNEAATKNSRASLGSSQVEDEQEKFLLTSLKNINYKPSNTSNSSKSTRKRKAKLAQQETIEDDSCSPCFRMLANFLKRKLIFIPLILITCVAAIYCLPFIDIEPQIPKQLPHIPFNFREGPLRVSSASQFKVERLFMNQIHGPESVAIDATGNMYMAIEGGLVLYAHLNKSSPIKWNYYDSSPKYDLSSSHAEYSDLVKIAELNGIKQLPPEVGKRRTREHSQEVHWRRECQLDEHIYGRDLYFGGHSLLQNLNAIDADTKRNNKFMSNVLISRCSKPLGIRLSPDENYLYVVDTLSGLYRVSLKISDRPHSTQRLVTKLIDFRLNRNKMLPVEQLDLDTTSNQVDSPHAKSFLNITLQAIDDLVIDYKAGTRGGDIIYLTDASQSWPATSYIYDLLEGRPSGAVLRYDTGSNLLSVINPSWIANVRTSRADQTNGPSLVENALNSAHNRVFGGVGAPRLDEDDVFDDRPLHFPNGLELTDDRQALLIADTTNKRIIKHFIRGPRKGTSDLWAWTPMYPDNIRRGYDRQQESYWVAGCGQDTTDTIDFISLLNSWPKLRKYILKNIYLFGWMIEMLGTYVLRSVSVRDFGYSFKVGHSIMERLCPGMMILQYNNKGDIIRSIYSREFPNDLAFYSQVNEVIDAKNQEHLLYLSSVSYNYVTKITLPTDSFDLPSNSVG